MSKENQPPKEEVGVKVIPSKLGRMPVVTTVGFREFHLPEIFYFIKPNKDPKHDYSKDIAQRGALLSEFSNQVIEDPSIINLGVIAPHGQVVGFNHKKENERIYLVTPLNLDSDPESKAPIHERIMLSITLITREAIKTLDQGVEVFMFD